MGANNELRSLTDILDALDSAADGGKVSLRDVLKEIGTRAFAPLLLVPALILVSPLSGIIGLPTIGAILMGLITVQKLLGQQQLWLPAWLMRRRVRSEALQSAVDWLRRPCAWLDRHTEKRLRGLVARPANKLTAFVITALCVVIPFLEIVPFVTSLVALAISLFAIGLLARDGLFTLMGYAWVAISGGAAVILLA